MEFYIFVYKACAVSLYTILVREVDGRFVTLFFNMSQNDLKRPNRILLIFSAIHIKSLAFRFATPTDARNVQVVGCDFRNFAVPKFPFKVVSNIPYGITSDIFKILMFESLGNFLGGSIVLQLEPTQKLFSRKLYNPYTVFYHTFFDLKLVYEVGPESFLPPPTVKSALLNIKRKHLFFDFKFKAKYLAFISCLLEKPDLSVKTALKSIFRKSQVRSISEKFGLNLNAQIVCLSPSQWLNCFLEMLEVVPEKFHPS